MRTSAVFAFAVVGLLSGCSGSVQESGDAAGTSSKDGSRAGLMLAESSTGMGVDSDASTDGAVEAAEPVDATLTDGMATDAEVRGDTAGRDASFSVACDPAPDAGAPPQGDAAVPLNHRAAPACCSSQRDSGPPGQPYRPGYASSLAPDAGGCTSDSDCTAGVNGRCFPFEGIFGPGGCSYDECFTDSTCGSKTPCSCRSYFSSPTLGGPDNGANVCVPGGNCAVDSDCGPGGFCSPSQSDRCLYDPHYYCHTALDTCENDSDCPAAPPECNDAGQCGCPTYSVCAYDTQAQHWACKQGVCCPP